MHTNYYFLRQLGPVLESQLAGLTLMECFSQDRDELVLVFAQARGKINYYRPFYIKATLRPDFSGLLFPESVQRARTNSADLFEPLYDRTVLGVRSFLNERCLAILLDGNYTLLFKFFGNRPNLIAFEGNGVIDLFNSKLVTDNQLVLDAIDRPIDQSYEAYVRAGFDHRKLFPTFGKVVNAYLAERGIGAKEARGKGENEEGIETGEMGPEGDEIAGRETWHILQEVLAQLEKPRYYLTRIEHRPALSLLPVGEIRREFDDPLDAANRFYIAFNGQNTFERERGEMLRLLDKRLKRAQAYINTHLERLIEREDTSRNEQIANILMANLHQIPEPPGSRSPESVTLYDFYRDREIAIKLKPDLSPQKNAEGYYRKSKNEKIEEEHLQKQFTAREEEIKRIQEYRAALDKIETLKELRKYSKQHNLLSDSIAEGPAQLFKEFEHEGFRILIGRNAKNNDLLTQRYSYKDDLWLHARDVSGSHVVVKHQAGKTFPKTVIERAAELAAWYSKRRTDSLCPVIVTPKKFVRKPKGLAEGQVVVDKEDVIMVVPKGDS